MNKIQLIIFLLVLIVSLSCTQQKQTPQEKKKPNIILVITDDQGYGDIAAHGNPYIKTPHLDKFHSESIRLTDFHVSPTCSPTRAALMTGRYTNRTGAWHTIAGWSLLREEEKTLADMFSDGGYKTGAFGKWHLGDNYPYRVIDRGFQESVVHGGGGVQQTPDYWGNDYFNDTYFNNGTPQKYEGYCTDVFFDESIKFITEHADEPFFCYISTNAPHGPFNVPPKYEAMYSEYDDNVLMPHQKQFLGMITNIDENFGKLRQSLVDLKIADNTILIFMADNGTAAGYNRKERRDPKSDYLGFNAGMRGTKNSEYEGGHRVPFFIYWKDGELHGGKDLNQLTAHIDVMPTLANLCGISLPEKHKTIDGVSLHQVLKGEEATWGDRILVTDSQREQEPARYRKTAVMKDKWRLVNGKELYNIKDDPSQSDDIADQHVDLVEELQVGYDKWWESVSVDFQDEMDIRIGSDQEPITALTTHDWHAPSNQQRWNQLQIRTGKYGNGYWSVNIEKGGEYEISLRRYPKESGLKFNDIPEAYTSEDEPGLNSNVPEGKVLEFVSAQIKVGDKMSEKVAVDMNEEEVIIKTTLDQGRTKLWSYLTDAAGETSGAYYAYVRKL